MSRHRVFDIQHRADLSAHSFAIRQSYALGPVDKHPDYAAPAAPHYFEVRKLVAQSFDCRFEQPGQLLTSHLYIRNNYLFLKQKMGLRPILVLWDSSAPHIHRTTKNPVAGFRIYQQGSGSGAGFRVISRDKLA
jgi:hypothetical protein